MEPLKGKRVSVFEQFDTLISDYDKDGNFFHYEDVKSAVLGLLKEIKNYPPEFIMEAETEEDVEGIKKDIVRLVRKWFPDVLEDEEDE